MKVIRTRYLGPTTFKGSRIVADDQDGNRVVISYEIASGTDDAHFAGVQALCKKKGWTGKVVPGWFGKTCYWVFVGGLERIEREAKTTLEAHDKGEPISWRNFAANIYDITRTFKGV